MIVILEFLFRSRRAEGHSQQLGREHTGRQVVEGPQSEAAEVPSGAEPADASRKHAVDERREFADNAGESHGEQRTDPALAIFARTAYRPGASGRDPVGRHGGRVQAQPT